MHWIILILITLNVNILTFVSRGLGGGFIMLVALIGFSETDATPIFIIFALMVFGICFLLSTASCWAFIKARHVKKTVQFWKIAVINLGVNKIGILGVLSFFAIFHL